jgi:two-component system, sensor histidine kinase and response regulator
MNNRPKILIVDDKPENLVALERVLKDLDIDIVKATSGNDALKATIHHHFALALLDIQMPEMDGYELAGILREEERTQKLPFIFISAVYTDNLNVFKGYEKGAFSFITKPFQAEILLNKVKFFIEKHQQEIELYNLNIDLINTNSELQAINDELESFSYSISHDLRAPLRAINGYSQMLEEDFMAVLNEEGKRLLGNIQANAKKMGILIDELLAFSKLGRKELRKTEVDMLEVVRQVLKDIQHTSSNEAEISMGPILPAYADRTLIYQVWYNLISNAIKYSSKKDNPQIEIGCTDIDGKIIYYVKDNGAGFDMKYANKLFGVFQRLHNAEDFEGTGIGLAIVQRMINKHGGKIWCEAEIDKGATFYFSLPELKFIAR